MSTFEAVAPPLSLFGPLPRAPMFGLLPQLARLGGDLLPAGESHWEAGANVWMYPCEAALPHDPCASTEGTYDLKDEGSAGEQALFQAFTAYATVTCSTISMGDYDEFARRIETVFEAVESAAVEKELSQGTALVTTDENPSFSDADMTTPGGTGALAPEIGLRWLEYAIALTGRAGIIHAPPPVVAAWRYDELTVDDNGVLRTLANGTPVIAGPGYLGARSPASGNSWAFATGAVAVRRGGLIRLGTEVESIERGENIVTVRAERDYLAVWDPCIQAGVQIDWTPA